MNDVPPPPMFRAHHWFVYLDDGSYRRWRPLHPADWPVRIRMALWSRRYFGDRF